MSNTYEYDHLVYVPGGYPTGTVPICRKPEAGLQFHAAPIWWWLEDPSISRWVTFGQKDILRELRKLPKGALPVGTVVPKLEHSKHLRALCRIKTDLRFSLSIVERMTLEIKLQSDGRSAPWQGLRAYYHRSWSSYFRGGKRVHLSLEGFLKKRATSPLAQKELDKFLKAVYERLEPSVQATEGLQFFTKNGGCEDSPQVFTRVYTNVREEHGDDYPSVAGSCVRHTTERLGMPKGYAHPVTAYCTNDISIAWLADAEGYTVARTLVNHTTGAIQRIYRSAPALGDKTTEKEIASARSKLLEQKVREVWPKPLDNAGLRECRLMAEPCKEEGGWIVPYLDQGLSFDTTGRTEGGREELLLGFDGYYSGDNTDPTWLQGSDGGQRDVCCHCGDYINDGECGETSSGDPCCVHCWVDRYFLCERCDETLYLEDIRLVDGVDRWCEYCARHYAAYCDSCSEYTTEDTVYVDNEIWCSTCVDNSAACYCCHRCGEYTTETGVEVDGSKPWCPTCASDYAYECPSCGAFASLPYDDDGHCSASCQEEQLEELYDDHHA